MPAPNWIKYNDKILTVDGKIAIDLSCCCGCVVLFDDFDRANSTDLGGNWIENSGDWEILTTELAALDVGMVLTTATIGTVRRNVSVIARDAQNGKTYRLIIAAAADGSEYICIEFACGDGTAIVSLKMNSGAAIDSFEVAYDAGEDYTLVACVSDEGTYGGLAEVSFPVWDCIVYDGPRAGIANVGADAEYDDFNFVKHQLDADDEDLGCVPCMCECDGKCLPREVTLTLESTCEHRDGLTITLTLNEAFYPAFVWEGVASWPEPLPPFTSTTYNFRLFCSRSTGGICGDNFALCAPEFMGGCSSDTWDQDLMGLCTDLGTNGRCADSEECDPLEIRFGPGTCEGSGDPAPEACTETLVVTI